MTETGAAETSTTRHRIVIADKNPVVRAGLVDFIGRDGRFDVVAAVSSGEEFLALCAKEHAACIGIIGWALPDMTGAGVLNALKQQGSRTRVIVYTGEAGADVLRQAVRLGAWGFISKADDPSVLLDTIATVARNRLCLPYVDLETIHKDPLDVLTLRERELLVALASGWSNLQIAARIGISRNTVKYHLKNLYDKLGVSNRAMAVALYMSVNRDGR